MTTASQTQLEVTEAWAGKTQWFLPGCRKLGMGKRSMTQKKRRGSWHLSLSQENFKKERGPGSKEQTSVPRLAPLSTSSAGHTCRRPAEGLSFPTKGQRRNKSQCLGQLYLTKVIKVITTLMALCVSEVRCVPSFQCIQI